MEDIDIHHPKAFQSPLAMIDLHSHDLYCCALISKMPGNKLSALCCAQKRPRAKSGRAIRQFLADPNICNLQQPFSFDLGLIF